jgi:hypothetical protein
MPDDDLWRWKALVRQRADRDRRALSVDVVDELACHLSDHGRQRKRAAVLDPWHLSELVTRRTMAHRHPRGISLSRREGRRRTAAHPHAPEGELTSILARWAVNLLQRPRWTTRGTQRLAAIASDGNVSRLTQLEGMRGRLGYYFSADARYLYFTWYEDEGDIWVMDVANNDR